MGSRYGRNQRRQAREALAHSAHQLGLAEEQKAQLFRDLTVPTRPVACDLLKPRVASTGNRAPVLGLAHNESRSKPKTVNR